MSRAALLHEIQAVLAGLPEPEKARRLGISISYWGHIRAGRRRLTDNLIRDIRHRIPELDGYCVAALLASDGERGNGHRVAV